MADILQPNAPYELEGDSTWRSPQPSQFLQSSAHPYTRLASPARSPLVPVNPVRPTTKPRRPSMISRGVKRLSELLPRSPPNRIEPTPSEHAKDCGLKERNEDVCSPPARHIEDQIQPLKMNPVSPLRPASPRCVIPSYAERKERNMLHHRRQSVVEVLEAEARREVLREMVPDAVEVSVEQVHAPKVVLVGLPDRSRVVEAERQTPGSVHSIHTPGGRVRYPGLEFGEAHPSRFADLTGLVPAQDEEDEDEDEDDEDTYSNYKWTGLHQRRPADVAVEDEEESPTPTPTKTVVETVGLINRLRRFSNFTKIKDDAPHQAIPLQPVPINHDIESLSSPLEARFAKSLAVEEATQAALNAAYDESQLRTWEIVSDTACEVGRARAESLARDDLGVPVGFLTRPSSPNIGHVYQDVAVATGTTPVDGNSPAGSGYSGYTTEDDNSPNTLTLERDTGKQEHAQELFTLSGFAGASELEACPFPEYRDPFWVLSSSSLSGGSYFPYQSVSNGLAAPEVDHWPLRSSMETLDGDSPLCMADVAHIAPLTTINHGHKKVQDDKPYQKTEANVDDEPNAPRKDSHWLSGNGRSFKPDLTSPAQQTPPRLFIATFPEGVAENEEMAHDTPISPTSRPVKPMVLDPVPEHLLHAAVVDQAGRAAQKARSGDGSARPHLRRSLTYKHVPKAAMGQQDNWGIEFGVDGKPIGLGIEGIDWDEDMSTVITPFSGPDDIHQALLPQTVQQAENPSERHKRHASIAAKAPKQARLNSASPKSTFYKSLTAFSPFARPKFEATPPASWIQKYAHTAAHPTCSCCQRCKSVSAATKKKYQARSKYARRNARPDIFMGEEEKQDVGREGEKGGGERDCCPHLLATAVTEALVDQINAGRIAAERVGQREVVRPRLGTWRSLGLGTRGDLHVEREKVGGEKVKKIRREGRSGVGRFGMMTAGLKGDKHARGDSVSKRHSESQSKPEGMDRGKRNWKQEIRNEARSVVEGMAGLNQAGWQREEEIGLYNGLAYAGAYTGL